MSSKPRYRNYDPDAIPWVASWGCAIPALVIVGQCLVLVVAALLGIEID